jgi:hypothetical protein
MRFQVFTAASMKMIAFWDVASFNFALMMEAVNTSETSVNFYKTTKPNSPEEMKWSLQ